jgi:hypothetical protein
MKILGSPYPVQVSEKPITIQLKNGIANAMLIQAQGVAVCYRYDGVLEPLNGFVLSDLERMTTHVEPTGLVVWASRGTGRLVVQEVCI